MFRSARLLLIVPLLAACATATVDMSEPRRLVGTESSVRVDAEIRGDELGPGIALPMTCVITNGRANTIAVADILPDTSYDPETRTLTVSIGSEVPGEQTLPRLIAIAPGEKKTISANVRASIGMPAQSVNPSRAYPSSIRVKVNFLTDTAPFADLMAMTQKALVDPRRADEVFPLWIESNEVVYTNAIPIRWTAQRERSNDASRPSGGRSRRW